VKVDETKSNKNEQLQIENSKAESSNINELNFNKITNKVEPLPAKLETDKTISYINKQGESVTETINVVDTNKSFLGGLFNGLKSLKKVDDKLKSHADEPKIKGIVSEKMAGTKTVVEGGAENIEAPKYFIHPDHSKLKPQMSGVDDNIVVDRLEKMRKHITTSPGGQTPDSSKWPSPIQNNDVVLPSIEKIAETQDQVLNKQIEEGKPLTKETLPIFSSNVQERVAMFNSNSKGKGREIVIDNTLDDTPSKNKVSKLIHVDKELISQNTGTSFDNIKLPVSGVQGTDFNPHVIGNDFITKDLRLMTRKKVDKIYESIQTIVENKEYVNLLTKTMDPSSENAPNLKKEDLIAGMELINNLNHDENMKTRYKLFCMEKGVDGVKLSSKNLDYEVNFDRKRKEFGVVTFDHSKILYQDDYRNYVKCVNHINNFDSIPDDLKRGRLSLEQLMSSLQKSFPGVSSVKPSDLREKSNQINTLDDIID